jgi:hypothetical protein
VQGGAWNSNDFGRHGRDLYAKTVDVNPGLLGSDRLDSLTLYAKIGTISS